MCGYCTESAALTYALRALASGAVMEKDSFILPSYTQDAFNWVDEVRAWPGKKGPEVALLAFCRHWEDVLGGGAVLPLPGLLGSALWVKLQERLVEHMPGPEWAWAVEPDGVLPADIPLSAANSMLESYVDGWLATGSLDRWSDVSFDEHFPWLFLALTIVSGAAAEAPALETIALTDPPRTPSFGGLDLWLQRRAARACVRQQGMAFVEEHFEDLRLELLASALLSGAFHPRNLGTLQNLLAERPHWVLNLTVEALQAATEHKLAGGPVIN